MTENWKIGRNTGCVISDVEPTEEDIRRGSGEVEYYGGVLVCESIRNPESALLIANAPVMKNTLLALREWLVTLDDKKHGSHIRLIDKTLKPLK